MSAKPVLALKAAEVAQDVAEEDEVEEDEVEEDGMEGAVFSKQLSDIRTIVIISGI
jgi:hypothetical protein